MTTPPTGACNTGGATFDPQESKKQSNSIDHGVNSHRIIFKLNHSPSIADIQTVVGASLGESPRIDHVIENLKPRLLELCESGFCLVSFGSNNSFERIKNNSHQHIKINSSSLIEQVLAQMKMRGTEGITLSDTVKLTSVNGNATTSQDGLRYLEGQIRFQVSGETTERSIHFLEFCPEYNGKNISSKTLLSALRHVPNSSTSNPAALNLTHNPGYPQFYSASGIGRSASLAVLYSFKEICKQHDGFQPNEVRHHLNTLIKQGREQRNEYFVNSRAQEQELLDACLQVNEQINIERKRRNSAETIPESSEAMSARKNTLPSCNEISPPSAIQTINQIDDAIMTLATEAPVFNQQPDKLPYMPVNLHGITKISSSNAYQFPKLSIEEAKAFSADILKAGFYGDALGAELESVVYRNKKHKLIRAAGYPDERSFNASILIPADRDQILLKQLKQNNRFPYSTAHRATDDTQQGALSVISKMNWMAGDNKNLNDLAGNTMIAFKNPKFPAYPDKNSTVEFAIRGGAHTNYMCKFTHKSEQEWHKVTIEEVVLTRDISRGVTGITPINKRAGGAGNGGMMRIGYDLLPMLASNSTIHDLIEQVLISNQITHPSSFSAVASVGQVILIAKCLHFRQQRDRNNNSSELPSNFFIDTYYDVAKALEHPEQNFTLLEAHSLVPDEFKDKYNSDEWRTARLPSQFLKRSAHSAEVINAGSVEQALVNSSHMNNSSQNIDSVLQRWSSNSYLGATFPTVVYLLEKFGYKDPALAVNMAALVTKDSDTCATIISQVMGALHGSKWVEAELNECKDKYGLVTVNTDLGGGFTLDNLISYTHGFFDDRENLSLNNSTA